MNDEIKSILERLNKIESVIFKEGFSEYAEGLRHLAQTLDFFSNERAFIKKYSSDKFSGQEYFTLVCAYLVKGKIDEPVQLNDIKKVWKRCAGVMNGLSYSSIYSTRAKENEWVNASIERGVYTLGKKWQEILN